MKKNSIESKTWLSENTVDKTRYILSLSKSFQKYEFHCLISLAHIIWKVSFLDQTIIFILFTIHFWLYRIESTLKLSAHFRISKSEMQEKLFHWRLKNVIKVGSSKMVHFNYSLKIRPLAKDLVLLKLSKYFVRDIFSS